MVSASLALLPLADATAILDRRLAEGQLSVEVYEQRRKMLAR